jgi:hypothetical protein
LSWRLSRRGKRAIAIIAACCVVLAAFSAIGAPYLFAEYYLRQHGPLVAPRDNRPVSGRWFDDYS